MAAIGPKLPVRQELFNKLLKSKGLKSLLRTKRKALKITIEKARQNAVSMMNEVAANFTCDVPARG